MKLAEEMDFQLRLLDEVPEVNGHGLPNRLLGDMAKSAANIYNYYKLWTNGNIYICKIHQHTQSHADSNLRTLVFTF